MINDNFFNLFIDIDEKYVNEAQHISYDPGARGSSALRRRLSVLAAAAGAAACAAAIAGVVMIRADLRQRAPDTGMSVDALSHESAFADGNGTPYTLRGTPLARGMLAEFTCDGIAEKCRGMLADDEELKAVLAEAPAGVEELYYRARALAEMVAGSSEFISSAFTDSALSNPNAAVIEISEDTPRWFKSNLYTKGQTFRETGYSYKSFYSALCTAFDEQTANQLLACNPYFLEHDGQLFCSPAAASPSLGLLHTEYGIEDSSDSSFTFTAVNYFPTFEMAQNGETEYDPAKKDQYLTTKLSNSFFRIIGRWRAQELCVLGSRSVWRGEVVPEGTVNIGGSEFRTGGVPIPNGELEEVRVDEVYAEYRRTLGGDKELKALFESLGGEKSALLGLYCDARALSDYVGQYEPLSRYLTSAAMSGRKAAYVYDPEFSSGYPDGIFTETGLRYGRLNDELRRTFTGEGLDSLLEKFSGVVELDGGAVYSGGAYGVRDGVLHTEYELVENTDTEIVFYTVAYMLDSYYESAVEEYDPLRKDSYCTQKARNRLVKTDKGWQTAEVSVCGLWNSAGVPETYYDPKSALLKTEIDYSEYYEALLNKDDYVYLYLYDGEEKLVDFMKNLDGGAAEVYLKAVAFTDGFARLRFLAGNDLTVTYGDQYYPTGYTVEAFENAMRDVFTVEAAQTVPANLDIFSVKNGELLQRPESVFANGLVTNEFELVSANDTEIEFKTYVYRMSKGERGKLIKTINNRIVMTEDGWRVEEMCLWGRRSSAEPADPDLP